MADDVGRKPTPSTTVFEDAMQNFTYSDLVNIKVSSHDPRAGELASVIAVLENRNHYPLNQFPPGLVYSVEFEDGEAVEVHEDDLELA